MLGLNDVSARGVNGETPLHQVAYRADLASAKLLLDAGADVNVKTKNGETPLNNARNAESIKLLLDAGADIDARDSVNGETPLHKATYNANIPLVQSLLEAGADPNIQDQDGRTAFLYAAFIGKCQVSYDGHYLTPEEEAAIDYEADKAESIASIATGIAMMKLLLEYGADPHIIDADGGGAHYMTDVDEIHDYVYSLGVIAHKYKEYGGESQPC